MRGRQEPARFGVVIYDGVEPIDLGATFGVLSMARRFLPGVTPLTIAPRPGVVRLASGLQVVAELGFADRPTLDALILCGGAGWVAAAADPAMLDFLRRPGHGLVASVCTGAMILGAAGLLAGHRATTRRHAVGGESEAPLRRLAAQAASVVEAVLVDAGPIVTGGGVSLATDLTLHLIGRFYGEAVAAEIARAIEYDRARAANGAALGMVRSG